MLTLCQNCIAYLRADDAGLDKCSKVPQDLNTQYVRDEPRVYSYCATQRGRVGNCGSEGRLFEEMPPERRLLQEWRTAQELQAIADSLGVAAPAPAPAPVEVPLG